MAWIVYLSIPNLGGFYTPGQWIIEIRGGVDTHTLLSIAGALHFLKLKLGIMTESLRVTTI